MRPRVVDTVADMQARTPTGHRVAVMTMGALHPGHAALMDLARDEAGATGEVVVSIFVNPLQFGEGEDFARYPRTWEQDLDICADHGVDVVFAPTADDLYAGGAQITVDPGPLGAVLEGAARPGHFRGVLTVVAKLLHIMACDTAVFGEKDYQQLVLIRAMIATLNIPTRAVGAPTVRDSDGLAMSSRNAYLSPAERKTATAIPRATAAARSAAERGANAETVVDVATDILRAEPGVEPDYVVVTDPDLGPAPSSGPARLLVAARVGPPRLLDNVPLVLAPR
ncbi:MAG: pantoate--beta-alanine ligase [Candidatus Nanopelagicales bacterium]